MRTDPQRLSKRLAQFVARFTAKDLSHLVGCDVRTAENIKQGHWPIARHWLGLVQTFGADVIDAVFGPDIDATNARLQGEIRELEQALESKRAAARQAQELAGRLEALRSKKPAGEG